jgi:hypothetical protein
MTPFPWKPLGALTANWVLTNLDGAHAPIMSATGKTMTAFVPAAVQFVDNCLPGIPRLLLGGSVEQVGQNVERLWPSVFDAMFSAVLTAARSSADALFGPIP